MPRVNFSYRHHRGDWTSAQLDLSLQTSNRFPQLAYAADCEIDQAMSDGRWGLDRAAALVKLGHAGLPHSELTEAAENYSLGRLYGLLGRIRHITPSGEQDVFEYRYLVIQPSLDESVFKLWGALPGIDGRIVAHSVNLSVLRAANRPALGLPPSGSDRPYSGDV